ncbi:TIGR01777 family oxidoreductase [Marinomonas algarum]|uniref:TIGR01777 family oxidoreductase n=1 Tax=Marinomonas algarum TaxID=2883105 RepID=A0A9X1IL68_9GAMM|nr:TIGR01777 family oxidoreductase [Marinomonas algarum]MCB5160311.1 TIGR01777 family oxidoreductase [Marinomonas algarum]
MNILLSGATGFIGQSLLETLSQNSSHPLSLGNHKIYALVRAIKPNLSADITQVTLDTLPNLDAKIDVFINLAGENIASKPWTEKRKHELHESRVTLTDAVRASLKHPPSVVVSMSAIGFYGVSKDGIFDEDTLPESGFAHDLCKAWEASAKAFESAQTRVVIYRLGVVLGKGGALEKMRLPFKLGGGGPIAGGDQWFAWIHIQDVVKAILSAVTDSDYQGVYNLVAPQLVKQKDFAKAYGSALGRPALLPTPKWLLTLIFGEMASLLTEGPQIIPKRLEKQGFDFSYPDIALALQQIEHNH